MSGSGGGRPGSLETILRGTYLGEWETQHYNIELLMEALIKSVEALEYYKESYGGDESYAAEVLAEIKELLNGQA